MRNKKTAGIAVIAAAAVIAIIAGIAVFMTTRATPQKELQAFAALLQNFYSGYLTWDRVHPNEVGQLVIARQLMRAVEPLLG